MKGSIQIVVTFSIQDIALRRWRERKNGDKKFRKKAVKQLCLN